MRRKGIGRRDVLAGAGGLLAAPGIVCAEGTNGVALVVGNSKYKWEASLPNAKRDVTDIARCFEAMGLKTELVEDAARPAMDQALEKFAQASRGASLAAFYFAGHGASWEALTYLVPVDADLRHASAVKGLISVHAPADAAQGAQARLMVFDNCRNNPADGQRQQKTLDRAKGSGTGLNGDGLPMPPDTLSIYSTAPGRVALDGPAGDNSPFASVLLRRLSAKTVELTSLNPNLRRQLLIETEGRQLIWGGQKFGQPRPIKGTGTRSTAREPRAIDPARLVELKNAYAFAREIESPLPSGMVAIRPPQDGPAARMVGAYKFVGPGEQPHLWLVLSAHDGKSAEVIMVTRVDGKPQWRYFQAAVSGNTLDALPWSGGERFVFKWNDKGSGEVTGMGTSRDARSTPVSMPFVRLDG